MQGSEAFLRALLLVRARDRLENEGSRIFDCACDLRLLQPILLPSQPLVAQRLSHFLQFAFDRFSVLTRPFDIEFDLRDDEPFSSISLLHDACFTYLRLCPGCPHGSGDLHTVTVSSNRERDQVALRINRQIWLEAWRV